MESTSLNSDRFPEGLRILVVDADAACLKSLEKMLTKCKYQVRISNLGREALDMIEKGKNGFDMVMSDENVGDMDGFVFVEQVGRLETNLPVIMMSSNGETSSVMKGVKHGACDYLVKPIRPKDIRYIWQHVFRKRISSVNAKESIDISTKTTTDHGDDGDDGQMVSIKKRIINESSAPVKKPRVVWTSHLHNKFEEVVRQIGVQHAGPKKILELMGIPWLSRENVASHLQKYRLFLARQHRENEVKAAYAGKNVSNMYGQSGNSLTLQQNIVINENNYCPSNVNGEGNMYGDHHMTYNQQLQLNESSSISRPHYNQTDFNPHFQYDHFPIVSNDPCSSSNSSYFYSKNRHYAITENTTPHHTLSTHYHQQNMNLGPRPALRLQEVELAELPSALEDIYLQDPHTVCIDSLGCINQEGLISDDHPHSAAHAHDHPDTYEPQVWHQ